MNSILNCAMMKNISLELFDEKVFNELFNPEHSILLL